MTFDENGRCDDRGDVAPRAAAAHVDSTVVLLVKNPIVGRVKTRLVPAISAAQAADLYRAFVGDMVEELSQGHFELRVAWALEDGEAPEVSMLPFQVPGMRQSGEGLGERLLGALSAAGGTGRRVAAVGSDHPELDHRVVEEALDGLADCEVVIGPAVDGGYYLIAAASEAIVPRLFEDITWSTDRVLEQTLERCAELGLKTRLLDPGADVDTPADLSRLARWLATHPGRAPRSAQCLADWGRM